MFKVQGLGLRVQGLEFRIQGSGFRGLRCSGLRVWGLEFGVQTALHALSRDQAPVSEAPLTKVAICE